MKFVTISDTHTQHRAVTLPEGDVLLHAGDVSGRGTETEVKDFLKWFAQQPFEHKIFIAGNHDFFFEKHDADYIASLMPEGVTYLNDSETTINGIKIWGSPITPWFFDWAFNRQRGTDIAKHWALIPPDTDIIMTHGPVYGYLDRTTHGEKVGCADLRATVEQLQPKVCIGGHIHEGYGQIQTENTLFINASVLNVHYRMTNEPVVFEL